MKNLANIISLSRAALALSLFAILNNKIMFIIITIICWMTDVIDGKVARLTNSASDTGSRIDDIADTTLIVVTSIIMIIWLKASILLFIPYAIFLVILKLINMSISKKKYGSVYIIHTYAARFTCFLILLMPIIYLIFSNTLIIYIMLLSATYSFIEEGLIHLTNDEFNSNSKSLLGVIKSTTA